jgi:uncharacterized membrane protein
MNEHRIHQVFEISVLLKGAHALIESISGIALYLLSTDTIVALAKWITQEELIEDPNDFIAMRLLRMAQDFSVTSKSFYSFYLLSHGLVKLFLVVGLLRNRMWSYPASLVVMAAFIAYQLYRYSYTFSLGLLVLTIFDVIVIALVWHEWRLTKQLRTRRI